MMLSQVDQALNHRFQRFFRCLCDLADGLGAYRATIRIAFWLLLALVLVGIVLDHGALRREDVRSGPFRASVSSPDRYAVDIGAGAMSWLRLRLIDIDQSALPSSGVRLLQDGKAIELPASPRPQIGLSERSSFGLPQRELTFVLPKDVANDGRLSMVVDYTAEFHRTLSDIVLMCFIVVVALRLTIGRHHLQRALIEPNDVVRSLQPSAAWCRIIPVALIIFPLLSVLMIAAIACYAATIVYGIVAGHVLPSATAFHLMPPGLLSAIEARVPAAILIVSAAGALIAWAASLHMLPVTPVRQTESALLRIWAWCGLPVIIGLFLLSLSAGGWSGNIRPQDFNYLSLATLAPHSDARGYFTDAYHAAFFGHWDLIASRRPLAGSFRQLTVFAGGFSYVGTLLVQLCMVATAVFVAARIVAGQYGIWAAMAFVGLIYVLVRPFLYTIMTEPFGLIWALLSIVFFLEAFRLHSLPHALVGLATLTIALLTRMGSMFTIPILMLWIAYAFATTWSARLRAFTLACAVVASVVALNALLASLYASPHVTTGSNFSYTFCGLSRGTNWSECIAAYEQQLLKLPDEKSQAKFLMAAGWQNILEQPSLLIGKVADNLVSYVRQLPEFLLEGYPPSGYHVASAVVKLGVIALLLSVLLMYRRRGTRTEGTFWLLVCASSAMSASIILADDGWRALHVTNALLACLLATGFSAPSVLRPRMAAAPLRWQYGVGVIAVLTALFVVAPPVSRALVADDVRRGRAVEPAADEMIVPGGRFITGFQVIPDGSDRPLHIPTLFVSEFVKLMRITNVEADFGPFVDLALGRVPFAVVVTGRFDAGDQSNILIAPVTLLTRPEVATWRLKVRQGPPGRPAWNTLREALAAEPIP